MPALIELCEALDDYSEIAAGIMLYDNDDAHKELEKASIVVEAARAKLEGICPQ